MEEGSRKRKIKINEKGILTFIAVFWAIVDLLPVYLVITWVFTNNTKNLMRTFVPNSVSAAIEHISYVMHNCDIPEALKDTMIYTVIAIAVMLVTASLAAYEFKFYDFPGKNYFFPLLCCP